jgi:D-cysteine desulfhydrase
VELARLPTPLEPMRRLSERLGVELLVKRDDLTGAELTGNKVRKLEFLLADAQARGADTVITCGGAQSNHCRATAIAAARLGLRARLLLRVAGPPPPVEGNILLDRLVGADIVWVTPDEYRRRAEVLFPRESAFVTAAGGKPYVVPEGGSNALGAWGYVRALEELAGQLGGAPATIVHTTGSGETTAGLALGVKLLGVPARVCGVNVCDDRAYFVRVIGQIAADFGQVAFDAERDVEIVDGHVGRGYALSRPEELATIRDVARAEAVVLDPVYTGKAFHGMLAELARDPRRFGARIVFLHTGGIFGLFPVARDLEPLL